MGREFSSPIRCGYGFLVCAIIMNVRVVNPYTNLLCLDPHGQHRLMSSHK